MHRRSLFALLASSVVWSGCGPTPKPDPDPTGSDTGTATQTTSTSTTTQDTDTTTQTTATGTTTGTTATGGTGSGTIDTGGWACGDPVDYDNHPYATTLIGTQCWFAENLRTTVYADGSVIVANLFGANFGFATSGATIVYGEGDPANGDPCSHDSPLIDACDSTQSLAEYGRLYNWHAVDDPRGLCPPGWHVPSDGEWTVLNDYVAAQGFAGMEGTALRTTTGWAEVTPGVTGNGTDDFGFAIKPSGLRATGGSGHIEAGNETRLWSSDPNGDYAFFRKVRKGGALLEPLSVGKVQGNAVRCLQDAPP